MVAGLKPTLYMILLWVSKLGYQLTISRVVTPSNPSSRMNNAFTDHSRLLTHVQPGFKNQRPKTPHHHPGPRSRPIVGDQHF